MNQDFSNYEVWFIDGASTDNTIEILAEYKAKYSCINFINEKDKGIYDAMNKGIGLSNGNWLYFLGSDDTFYSNDVLSVVAKSIEHHTDEVVYGNVIMRGQNQWNLDNVVFDGEYTLQKFIDKNICHQAMFFKRSLFEKNGLFNLKYITNADFDFNLRCYANSRFRYIDYIIANFYVGGQSTLVEDHTFHNDRGALLLKYFGKRIFGSSFLNARLYIQQAAWSKTSPLHLGNRLFCLLAYIKLKAQSLLSP